mgnify:CR=1 FL=1
MYNFRPPFFGQPAFLGNNNYYRKNYHNSTNFKKYPNSCEKNNTENLLNKNSISKQPPSPPLLTETTTNCNNIQSNEVLFEIFGLKIYFDDVLLICILLFLYQEGIQDEYLFISLILLLLS